MERQFIEGTWQNERTFSPAVCTTGGRNIWLAGHGATVDGMGNPIPHDFEAQTRQAFKNLEATLQRAGGTLQDIVTMTVFIIDSRHGTSFVKIREEFYVGKRVSSWATASSLRIRSEGLIRMSLRSRSPKRPR